MCRLQHAQMLVVRKEGKAHDQYNKFRSAFELLEAVGREPKDYFEENDGDLPPMELMQQQIQQVQKQINDLKTYYQQQINDLKIQLNKKFSDMMYITDKKIQKMMRPGPRKSKQAPIDESDQIDT